MKMLSEYILSTLVRHTLSEFVLARLSAVHAILEPHFWKGGRLVVIVVWYNQRGGVVSHCCRADYCAPQDMIIPLVGSISCN